MENSLLRTLEVEEMEAIEGGKASGSCHGLAVIAGGFALFALASLTLASGGTLSPITVPLVSLAGGGTLAAANACLS
jgi:hypothetical protein